MNTDILSRYRLLERIGAGGMGEVWKAHDARLDRIVAVKMLLRGALGSPNDDAGRERFRREALTLSRLSHAGIATVFDFDAEGDHEFLVMEFVAGGTLESRPREGPLTLVEIQPLGAAIADALEYAHRHSVLHRDLKPGNVALTTEGQPKINRRTNCPTQCPCQLPKQHPTMQPPLRSCRENIEISARALTPGARLGDGCTDVDAEASQGVTSSQQAARVPPR